MFLKKLDLIGFKSFADPTTITFQPGITVIVGPNGCGKSNIVDAILWVLGEQSTKTLRSDRMEDVIFNGSESRKPINMVEVVLTVGGVSPEEVGNQFGEFEELSLSRRLFRSGESEYLINRIPCRLRDIRDVLIDTGAGHKGHTIIEQGKVDQLLNASPLERRDLIEETAGISKYKIRKAEAERKLEATQQNLLRLGDIISEVKRQILGLDRQVKRTETYNAMRSEVQRLSLLLLTEEFRTVHQTWEETHRQAQEAQVTESAFLAHLASIEADIQNLKTGLVAEEQGLAAIRQQVYDIKTQIQRQESRIELLKSQVTGWEEQRTQFLQDQERLGRAQAQAAAQTEEVRHQQQTMTQTIHHRKRELAARDQTSQEFGAKITQQETARKQDSARLFDLLGLITEAKNQAAAMESRHREILRVQEKGRSEWTTVVSQLDENQKTLESESALLAAFEKKASEAAAHQIRLSDSIHQKQKPLTQRTFEINQQREDLTHAQARLGSLKEQEKSLLAEKANIHQQLSAHSELLSRFHGIVADLISVPKSYERAIEAVLGDRLQALVADDHPTIQAAMAHLKTVGAARCVFVPKTLRMKPGIAGTHAHEGVIGPALAHAEIRPGFETLLQGFLGGVILVQDIETALALWKQQPLSEILVTLEGEIVFPSGMVSGGQPPEYTQGLLQTRRKIKELEQEVLHRTAELAQAEEARIRQTKELERLVSEQENLVQSLHESELDSAAQRQKVVALESETARLSEHRSLLDAENQQGIQEARKLETSMGEIRRQLSDLEEQQNLLEHKITQEQENLKQWLDQQKALSAELTELKVDLTSLTERQEVLVREEQRLQQEQNALGEQSRQREAEAAGLAARIKTAQRDRQETEAAIGVLSAKLAQAQTSLTQKTTDYTEHLGRLKQLEDQQSGVRSEWSRAERLLKDLEVRQAELKTKVEHITEQLAASHSTTPEEALRVLDQEPFQREEASERLSELRTKIEQMGPVNLAAPDEYKELEERYRFLTTQEADLTRSIEDLKTAIQKINRTTKEMFLSAYQALRVKFSKVFSSFFEGGQADLILLDEGSPLESGIEIMAQPPGKRLRNIALLSGGEKALTAIALLFASFLIHPSPFCVLDEIDAPLDEENIRRFIRVLREMTDHSQFLIITHNKRTMEQADILYGVTMEEAGVSKLVSVKLESFGNASASAQPSLKAAISPSASV